MREIGGLLASSAGSNATTGVPTGLVLLAIGLILCFFGVRSLRLSLSLSLDPPPGLFSGVCRDSRSAL